MSRRERGKSGARGGSAPLATPAQPTAVPVFDTNRRRLTRWDWLAIAAVAIAAAAVFLPSARYGFVYDDDSQIKANILLQDSQYFWKAMTSDVWAFRPTVEGAPTSSYWRPTFVLWLMLNYRLFGVDNPAGWHAMNIGLHALASALAFVLVRRLGGGTMIAAAIGLVFATHPVHAESVAWISGSPDPVMAVTLFPAWMLALSARERGSWWRWAAALVFCALGLLSKETAVTFPLVLLVSFFAEDRSDAPARTRWARAFKATLPYFGLVGLYFLGRLGVFGAKVGGQEGMIARSVLTAPATAAFYIRQCLLPVWVGPFYPLRPVTPTNLGLWNFGVPLLTTLAFTALALWRGRRDRLAWVGLALAAALIAPTMRIDTFTPDQIVHDRYLYIALLGGLLVVLPAAAGGIAALLKRSARFGDAAVLVAMIAASVPLGLLTVRAARAYESNAELWKAAVVSDPTSDFTWRQLGAHLQEIGRVDEALAMLEKSLAIRRAVSGLVGRADILMSRKQYEAAVRDLKDACRSRPPNFPAFERLAVCLDALGRTDEAKATLVEARRLIPGMKCAITERLAVYLQREGDLAGAARELQAVRADATRETDPRSRLCLVRLGGIYMQLERPADALRAYEEFLAASESLRIKSILDARVSTERIVQRLRKEGVGAGPASP